MSVRLPPSPRQHCQRATSRGLSVDGSARHLSRLSLVLAAGQRELATAAINDAKRKGGSDKLKQSSGNDQNKGGAGLSGRDTTNVSNGGEHRDGASGDGAACKVTLEEEADTEVDTEVETEGESIADGDSGGWVRVPRPAGAPRQAGSAV